LNYNKLNKVNKR